MYADFNGSAPLSEAVTTYLKDRLDKNGPYANPNAIHYLGAKCLMGMEKARKICAECLGAQPNQVIFNSGASEGISTAFYSLTELAKTQNRKIILVSGIEHSACVQAYKHYQKNGFEVQVIPTFKNGSIDFDFIKNFLEKNAQNTAFVCVMAANNETGVILPYEEISQLCRSHDVKYLCDTTQLIGKGPFKFEQSGIDFAVCSGHKIGALTGTGILLARDTSIIKPLIFGGGQELGLRGGTQNYIGNETMAIALREIRENEYQREAISKKREEFERKIQQAFPQTVILGRESPRLASTTLISFPGLHGQAVQIELESRNIFVTTSSACSDNEPVTSKVLKAMNISDDIGRGVVRISLSHFSPLENYDILFDALSEAYKKLGKIGSY